MGNCIRHDGSRVEWAGEEWEFSETGMKKQGEIEKEGFLRDSNSKTEVKIKMTKKQLEELLMKADVKELTVEQVLTQLIAAGVAHESSHHASWKPVLQSIPEVN